MADSTKPEQRPEGLPPVEFFNAEFRYFVPDENKLVRTLLAAVRYIAPLMSNLLTLYHTKMQATGRQPGEDEEKANEEAPDSYERTSQFNEVGMAVYSYFTLKPEINAMAMRQRPQDMVPES